MGNTGLHRSVKNSNGETLSIRLENASVVWLLWDKNSSLIDRATETSGTVAEAKSLFVHIVNRHKANYQ